MLRSTRVVWLLAGFLVPASALAEPEASLFGRSPSDRGLPIVSWKRPAVHAAARKGERIRIADFPLSDELSVDLEVEPFSVTSGATRFVRGRRAASDEVLDFDPSSVVLFRGRVLGRPGSHVFLAVHEGGTTGAIELGSGDRGYRISSRGASGQALGPGRSSVFQARSAPDLPPGVPFCGVEDEGVGATASPLAPLAATVVPGPGIRHLELAVDTDHEFFQLFGDLDAAAAYLVSLYAEVSDVYLRDQDVHVELVFARLWDDPNDLFNDVDPSPLGDFRSYWNANMGSVQRDVAQLLSGRRDYPFGGQAYLSTLCGASAYSVVGYALGFFPDPASPSPYHYDISVTAHEIGHNAGTGHTHDSPNFVDTCHDPLTTPQRGSIMSYCGQTWSGGNANRDLYFHSRIQQNINAHVAGSSCVVGDCNLNFIDDASDVAGGGSADLNGNGVPDECEDCNVNSILDDDDIGQGGSLDLNANGIPDECEPDCNGNGVPDDKDIADATSLDLYGNDVPDECEVDCDNDATSDYSEIQADMSLDVDRSAGLDACQDCDTDGTPDLEALAGAHGLWLASGLDDAPLREFHATTGVLTGISSGGAAALPKSAQDLLITPGGRVLVSSADDDRVLEFDLQGSYLGDLVPSGSGGLDHPTGLLLLPGDVLLVASQATDAVLAYDALDGTPLGSFVSAGSGGLVAPFGLTRTPDGQVLVTSGANEVLEYDGSTGAFQGALVSAADNGGLDQPRGMVFKPDGHLLVASFGSDEVLEFEGTTGASRGRWALSGTATRLTQVSPWGLRVGPNGNVFLVRTGEDHGSGSGGNHDHEHAELHLTNAQIYEFDVANGLFLRSHVNGNDHGMEFPTGFDFVPGHQADCNRNQLPDSCDVSSGTSADGDGNGTPDECEVDCNANGELDRLDLIPYGDSFDCDFDGTPDECQVGAPGVCQDGVELTCDDGFDNDRDGRTDCVDGDCQGRVECPGRFLISSGFESGADGFVYQDDAFRSTQEPAYASGSWSTSAGFSGGGLRVDLGGIDGNVILGMSGGFQRDFTLAAPREVSVEFRYELTQSPEYESNELSQVMSSVDGVALGAGGNDYVAQLAGDGNGGDPISTGWASFSANLGVLAPGPHSLVIGGYNSRKSLANESTEVRLDDVLVVATPQCSDGLDNDGDGKFDFDGAGQGDPDPHCSGAIDDSERPRRSCGIGFELAVLMSGLLAVRRSTAVSAAFRDRVGVPTC